MKSPLFPLKVFPSKSALAALLLAAAPILLASPASAQSGPDGAQEAAPEQSFADWRAQFRAEALAAGIEPQIFDDTMAGVDIVPRVFELNDNQPEFSRTIWDYIDGAVSAARVEKGQTRFAQNRALLSRIEQKYGVSAEIIVAIWGLESSYGDVMGSYDAVAALATLAWKGRRTDYGRPQLIGALKIIQNGHASRDQLKSSWAGAMGHTQFIPTTYLAHAVDENGDGRRDIWANLEDVFGSTANYLARSGYELTGGWGAEIVPPADFDYDLAAPDIYKPLAEWAAMDIGAELIGRFDPNSRGRIILPAGANGPAFMVFRNFEAILKYNRSTSYALAVGMLSDRVAGRTLALKRDWPRGDRALSLSERKTLQEALRNQGFDPGPIDGVIGAGTRRALKDWQRAQGLPADGYASADTLLRLTS